MEEKQVNVEQLTQMINAVMGKEVLTAEKLRKILNGAVKAREHGGMDAVWEYLLKVTQADVDPQEIQQFANQVQSNPQLGMEILSGNKRAPLVKRHKRRK